MEIACPNCQHLNPQERLACIACGEPLTSQPTALFSEPPSPPSHRNKNTWTYLAVLGALAIGGVAFRLLVFNNLDQSAALFIGLPTLIGTLLVLAPQPKSHTGIILRGMSLGLLLSGPLLGEGFICIVMAAPLFLGIGLLIGLCKDRKLKKESTNHSSRGHLKMILPIPLLFLMSLEGSSPDWSFNRQETVSVTRQHAFSISEVEQALNQAPQFKTPPSGILGIGFPIPLGSDGSGLRIGDRRVIHFSGGEGRPPGDLTLEVTEKSNGYARFSAISDTSHITHWLNWTGSEVYWKADGPKLTSITWTIHFERKLDPAWYFSWPERMIVQHCADYLIETCAMP